MKDTATTILYCSEALLHLSETLPEDMSGLAYIMGLMAKKLAECGEELDNANPLDNTE